MLKFFKFQDCTFSIVFSHRILPFFILFSSRNLPYFHFFLLPNVSLLYPLLSLHTHSYQSNDHLHNNLQRIIKKFLKTHPSLLLSSFFYQIFPVTWYFCFFFFFFYDQVEIHETYFAALKIRVEELRPILMKISRRELVVQVRCRERRRMRGKNKKRDGDSDSEK